MASCSGCGQVIAEHRLYGTVCGCFPGVPKEAKPHVNDGSKQAHAVSDFTASLGPVRIDPNSVLERARLVREAMRETGDYHLKLAAGLAQPEALARLGRLLK